MKYDVLTVAEAAKKIGVTTWTMYALIHEGTIKAYNVGFGTDKPRWRIREEDLIEADYTKYARKKTEKKPVEKKKRPKAVVKKTIDARAELASLKEDLLNIVLRIEELENKL